MHMDSRKILNAETNKLKSCSTSIDANDESKWGGYKTTKNLFILSFGVFLLFTGYEGVAYVQSTINNEAGLGVASQAVIYGFACFSALFLPKIFIKKFGSKIIVFTALGAYCPYIASNFYPTWVTLIISAALLGIGAGLFWAAFGTYINQLAAISAKSNQKKTVESIAAWYFGIGGTFYSCSHISGNLISFVVLENDNVSPTIEENKCGINFSSSISFQKNNTNFKEPSIYLRTMMTGIFLGSGIFAVLLIAMFLDSLPEVNIDSQSLFSKLAATCNMMKKKNQLLLMPFAVYYGLHEGFYVGDFTEAYIACSWGISHVGLVTICFGFSTALFSSLAGKLRTHIGRIPIFTFAAAANITVFFLVFLWNPSSKHVYMFFITAFLWGIFNGIHISQLRAFYGVLFRGEEESAFASYYLCTSIGHCLAFSYSKYLPTKVKLFILIAVFCISQLGYAFVEWTFQNSRNKEKKTVPHLQNDSELRSVKY